MLKAERAATHALKHRRFKYRGAIGALILAPVVLFTLVSRPPLPSDSWAHLLVQTIGWMLFVTGAALRFWSTLYLGGRKDAELVMEGPYSLCRNPLYLASLLLALSAGFFLESLLFSVATFAVLMIYQRTAIRAEEGILRRRHGPRFEAYVRSVPPVRPTFRAFKTPDYIIVHARSLRNEAARASRWVWLPLLAQLLTYGRSHGWWPTFFRGF